MPKNAGVDNKGQGPRSHQNRKKEKKEREKTWRGRGEEQRTADPAKQTRPGIARRRAPRDILDREQRDEARLQAEPEAPRQRVQRAGHGLEDRDERGEHDEERDEHVYEHRRRGRVGALQQVVQMQAPRRRDHHRRRGAPAPGTGTGSSRSGGGVAMGVSIFVGSFRVCVCVCVSLFLFVVVVTVGE